MMGEGMGGGGGAGLGQYKTDSCHPFSGQGSIDIK